MFDFSKVYEGKLGMTNHVTIDAALPVAIPLNIAYLDLLNAGVALISTNNDSVPILFGITSELMPNLR